MSVKNNPKEYSLKDADIFRKGNERGVISDKNFVTSYYEIAFKNSF